MGASETEDLSMNTVYHLWGQRPGQGRRPEMLGTFATDLERAQELAAKWLVEHPGGRIDVVAVDIPRPARGRTGKCSRHEVSTGHFG